MKTAIFILFLVNSCLFSFSQDQSPEKKGKDFGFWFGANYSDLQTKQGLPSGIEFDNNIGLSLGLLSEFNILKHISVSPKVGLSMYNANVDAYSAGEVDRLCEVFPSVLEFSGHICFKPGKQNNSVYILSGPVYRRRLGEKPLSSDRFSNGSDLAIDFGIGLERGGGDFIFAPELKYSVGLFDINKNSFLRDMYFNTFSLVLNFK